MSQNVVNVLCDLEKNVFSAAVEVLHKYQFKQLTMLLSYKLTDFVCNNEFVYFSL
jgi:hypothetical protein